MLGADMFIWGIKSGESRTINCFKAPLCPLDVLCHPLTLLLCRRYRDGQLLSTNKSKYEGGNLDQPSLVIKNISKEDIGIYSCVLENQLGAGESQNISTVDVLCKHHFFLEQRPNEVCSISDFPVSPFSSPRNRENGHISLQKSENIPLIQRFSAQSRPPSCSGWTRRSR